MFMSNRVKELNGSNNILLKYIDKKENSANLQTGGVLSKKLKSC